MTLQTRTAQMMLAQEGVDTTGPLAGTIQQLRDLAQSALAEMRALIFELRPEVLEQEGLSVGLQRHANAVQARQGIAVELEIQEEPEATLAVKEALYRIAQESMNNAVKHACAQHLGLRLGTSNDEVVLEVWDDGTGFDVGGSFPGHLGLHSMRERAAMVGGTIEVESNSPTGTLVRARIPLSRPATG
jgi:signal transduction histidine kinase